MATFEPIKKPVTGDVVRTAVQGQTSISAPSAKLSQVRARTRPDVVARRNSMINQGMKSRGLR